MPTTSYKTLLFDSAQISFEMECKVKGVPNSLYIEYAGILEDGDKFLFVRPKENWDYTNWMGFISGANGFKALPIQEVVRYKDGGTTEIKTSLGLFHFPSPFMKDQRPTLGGGVIPTILERDNNPKELI